MSGIYVPVVERDGPESDPHSRPIVWEQYIDQGAADLENVRAFVNKLGTTYGKVTIARLVFEGEEGFDA